MRFYLGTHQPAWLARGLGIPLLVSHRRLAGRRTLPRVSGPWALDSGGFTELSMHGRWGTGPRAYARAMRRYADEIGHLDWAAPQDWMTEEHVLRRTGLTVAEHQRRTVTNYLLLRDLDPDLPIIPVVQGQHVDDHLRCADLYHDHDVDLAALPLVGVGSVCRRQHTREVERIVRALAARGRRLHCFGVKTTGLLHFADAICSSDSLSWSFSGRYLPGCTPSHRTEANCLRHALAWHDNLLGKLCANETRRRAPPVLRSLSRPAPPRPEGRRRCPPRQSPPRT